jgi:cellulose synthase/poly-beta-1,6-N-acetylglucosamine synthase-like glycosyltransferase
MVEESFLPTVSVLISARNEENDIGRKIKQTLAWDYPADRLQLLVASDASTDKTDEILAGFSDVRFGFLRLEQRSGKQVALNRLVKLAQGDLLLFCDANSSIPPTVLRLLTRHFADPRIGCVTGAERTNEEGGDTSMLVGNTAFLGYESLVNQLESRLGSVLVCDGALFCMRRELFVPLQSDLANDLELPIHIGARRLALLFEAGAIAFEKTSKSARDEFNRRRRICGQGFLGMWRLRHSLRGIRLWQFLSRKVLRWFAVLPMTTMMVAALLLRRSPFFLMILVLQAGFYLLALAGALLNTRRRGGIRLFDLPLFLLLSNVGAFMGAMQSLFGRRFAVWQPIAREHSTAASVEKLR